MFFNGLRPVKNECFSIETLQTMRTVLKPFLFRKSWLLQLKSSFAVLPECCSCPCFFSGVFSLVSFSESLGGVSRSDGHSVFKIQSAKQKSRYIDIKNQREFFSRFKMMKLCIGFAKSETTCLFLTKHANRQCVNGWCGYDRLPLALPKKSFILFNCCDIQTVTLYK